MKNETKYVLMFNGADDRIIKFYVDKDCKATPYKSCALIGEKETFSDLLANGNYTLVLIDNTFLESVKKEEEAFVNFYEQRLSEVQKMLMSVDRDDPNVSCLITNLYQEARKIQEEVNIHKKGFDELRAIYAQINGTCRKGGLR